MCTSRLFLLVALFLGLVQLAHIGMLQRRYRLSTGVATDETESELLPQQPLRDEMTAAVIPAAPAVEAKQAAAKAAKQSKLVSPRSSDAHTRVLTVLPPPARVFSAGDGGVPCFRIPAIILTRRGTLVAFAEARRDSSPGCKDKLAQEIAVRRSLDQGTSWSPVAFAAGGPGHRVGNPYPIALRSGRIVLVYVKHAGSEKTCNWCVDNVGNGVVNSDDDGLTWSAERDVSEQFGVAKGSMPGPGAGVELAGTGRLLVVSHRGAYEMDFITYSDDGGETWSTLPQSFPKMDEAAFADLGNGEVLLNMRHEKEDILGRAVSRSYDAGMTWSAVSFEPALPGPISQASLAALGGSIFFANPASSKKGADPANDGKGGLVYLPTTRVKLTVQRSDDGGRSWKKLRVLREGRSWGYTSLVQGSLFDDAHSGVLYEATDPGRPSGIDFAIFDLRGYATSASSSEAAYLRIRQPGLD